MNIYIHRQKYSQMEEVRTGIIDYTSHTRHLINTYIMYRINSKGSSYNDTVNSCDKDNNKNYIIRIIWVMFECFDTREIIWRSYFANTEGVLSIRTHAFN